MQCIECYACRHCRYWCLWLLHNTLYRILWGLKTLLCIKWPLAPTRREGYLLQYSIWKAFCLGCLAVHQSEEAALLTFLDLSTTRVIAGKMHSQFLTLKLAKGVLSNPVILTNLQTMLHSPYPSQTACLVYKFKSKKTSSMLEECEPVEFLWSWQVQFLAKLANMSK